MVMAMGTLVACAHPDHALQPVDFDSDNLYLELEPLGRSIGDSRTCTVSVLTARSPPLVCIGTMATLAICY